MTAVKNAPPVAMNAPASRPRTIKRSADKVALATDQSISRCAACAGDRSPAAGGGGSGRVAGWRLGAKLGSAASPRSSVCCASCMVLSQNFQRQVGVVDDGFGNDAVFADGDK